MLARTDDLAIEAAKLLDRPSATVASWRAGAGGGARANSGTRRSTGWPPNTTRTRPPATALRPALTSRYQAVREAAAFELATKKDPAAFESLVAILAAAFRRPSSNGSSRRWRRSATRAAGRLPRPDRERSRPARLWPTSCSRPSAGSGAPRMPIGCSASGRRIEAARGRLQRPADDQRLRSADRRPRGRAARYPTGRRSNSLVTTLSSPG